MPNRLSHPQEWRFKLKESLLQVWNPVHFSIACGEQGVRSAIALQQLHADWRWFFDISVVHRDLGPWKGCLLVKKGIQAQRVPRQLPMEARLQFLQHKHRC